MPRLTPELGCTDVTASLAFYTGLLGFSVDYARPASGFYHLSKEGSALMLEQLGPDSWALAPPEVPLGRGLHLQFAIADAPGLAASLGAAEVPLFRPLEEAWYRDGARWHGQVQFVVADPDGYLLRFATALATVETRPTTGRIVE
ncbi:VOC family protein [Vannielia litorea]|uniref:Catechol 2,3-dioxygenase n=1 Tax=Vannielia litorea TaxID=1217970 RepID=A0A1N6DWB8_9RHOB|nr:VOC family protein [Vannielia litorea]SIN75062.1 Catechol 2,3-dioxygenase [Vannielia litorea]